MISRRSALPAIVTLVPRHVLGGQGYTAPSDRLNLAGVGVGGMGRIYLKGCESENITALCDVDHNLAAPVFARYPRAQVHRDYRVMLEKQKDIDAVVIGTPDHTHALIALAAMRAGKHVYCAKPLTRTLHEARMLAATAAQKNVTTQMSVQTCGSEESCLTEEWIKAGAVGAVSEVHIWTDRPIWPQGIARPAETLPVPESLDWDLWLGPAASRPYHPVYHPFSWRGWYDFGTGALGDMACHALHVVFRALGLEQPLSVSAVKNFVIDPAIEKTADGSYKLKRTLAKFPETFAAASMVTWDFDRVRLHWYDGGLKPPRPRELPAGENLNGSGVLYSGDKGVLLSGFSGGARLLTESRRREFEPPPKTLARTENHYREWIAACKGTGRASCDFAFGAKLTETALLGVLAQRTGEYLEWDSSGLRVTNSKAADEFIHPTARANWQL